MLIKPADVALTTAGLGDGGDFKIAASAKAFDILSSNLYQNKVLAVIREVSCNAADAHRMVNKPLSDIKIHLPTWSTPTFSVRDFGPGLSHKAMLTLYTTFFLSDKDKSNDLIGGLGLGSKSPFSVADQFIVTSWHEGRKRVYVCYKKNGIPAINLTSDDPSTEPSGLKVEVVVSSTRLQDWTSEAANYFKWWRELPSITPSVDIPPIFDEANYVVKAKTQVDGLPSWAFCSVLSSPTVYMGMVPYALNFTALPQLPSDVRSALSNTGLLLVFDIGELDINPSRETLSYNPDTCQALCARLASIYKTVQSEIEAKLATASSLYEARRIAFEPKGDDTNGTSLKSLVGQISHNIKFKPKWKGQVVESTASLDLSGLSDPGQLFMVTKVGWRQTWNRSGSMDLADNDLHHIISSTNHRSTGYFFCHTVGPITAKTYRTVQHYALENAPSPTTRYGSRINPDLTIYILVSKDFQEVADAFDKGGFPPLLKISDMPDPPKVASTSNRANATKTSCYTIRNAHDIARTEAELDLKGGGYYTVFYDGSSKMPMNLAWAIYSLLDPKAAKPFVGLAERRLKVKTTQKALAKEGWIEIKPETIALIDPQSLRHLIKLHTLQPVYYSVPHPKCLSSYAVQLLNLHQPATCNVPAEWSKLAQLAKEINDFRPATNVWNHYNQHLTDAQRQAILDGAADATLDKAAVDAYFQAHPLLGCIDLSKISDVSPLISYLNR